jgi:8-oxo-dGTP pyrophosphatase MutT (NUDIX family)
VIKAPALCYNIPMSPSFTPTITLERVRAALRKPLPGLAAQMRMSPQPRPGAERILDPLLDCRRAGVLLLLYPGADGLSFALTRRTESLASHQGQISLPGGSVEAGETPEQAAVRETWEELGIAPETVTLVGQLSPLYIPPSGFCIYPVVAYTAARPTFVPCEDEVAEVIEEPLAHLLAETTRVEETREIRGYPVRVPYYAIGLHKVWGATAMVLCEFAALLAD